MPSARRALSRPAISLLAFEARSTLLLLTILVVRDLATVLVPVGAAHAAKLPRASAGGVPWTGGGLVFAPSFHERTELSRAPLVEAFDKRGAST